jgi:nucleotide-binding universal stress UspA family protein
MGDREEPGPADHEKGDHPSSNPLGATGARTSLDPALRYGIVAVFDGSASAQRAVAYATAMAMRRGSGVIIVYVDHLQTDWWSGDFPIFADALEDPTEVLWHELAYAEDVPWILIEHRGDICQKLEQVGQQCSAEAIVVGAPQGVAGRIFGSVASRLIRRARRPIVVIP